MVTGDMLQKAASSGDWLMYGHNYWNNRFSPLSAINASNVKNLVPRMVLQTGTEKLGSFETTPVVVNGIMYVTTPVTPTNDVMAYDLRQGGKMLWRYTHKTGQNSFGVACCGPNNRGVAVANGALFLGTLDGQLIALDQQTGKEKWATQVGDPAFGYTETMAPLVIGDKVIIGTSERPARMDLVHATRARGGRVVGQVVQDDVGGRGPAPRHRDGEGRLREAQRRLEDGRRLDVDDAGLRCRYEDPLRRDRQPVA